ncbi:FAD-dependent oxidoreductase [Sulfurovum sp.]|uniref:NAD(P)/FAD-dependent oxidoreductase n=1 Tax=Sulfurovum sp. TaxID=1969726 RepID=UPI0025EFBB14|nr:FAD-dependent oxidoreductase [Sulfurovum sp.]
MKISYKSIKESEGAGMERRDALRLMGLGSAALLVGGSTSASAKTKLSSYASKKEAKIVIVGGGTAGMTAAARLRRSAPNAHITLIAPNETHLYQSGQVYVAAGLYSEFDNKRSTSDLLPDKVSWMKDKVTAFDPDKNQVQTEQHKNVPYDYLVVATGCEYDYSAVEGLNISDIGKQGISSVYLNDPDEGTSEGAILSRMWMKAIRRKAVKSEVRVLFADPQMPVKGEGASLSMLFLANDMLKGNGLKTKGQDLHEKVKFTLTKANKQLFPSTKIDLALKKTLKEADNVTVAYEHVLTRIERENKVAVYTSGDKEVEIPYDFLHITPAMKAPRIVRESELSVKEGPQKGWLEVEAETLRHPKYKNVFGLGDVVGLSSGKSGGAVREQAIVLQDNIAAIMEGEAPPATYEGYSVSPIKTCYGRVMLAEYTPKGLAPMFPLDPTKSRWIWWEMDLHLMRRAYFDLMMRGML